MNPLYSIRFIIYVSIITFGSSVSLGFIVNETAWQL